MKVPIYDIKHLHTNYGQKPVLDIHALHVNEGEILGLVGSNGSGKSTFLRHLAFLEKANSGTLLYKGLDQHQLPLHVKREIGILLPEPYLLKRSVKENLLFGLQVRNDTENLEKRLDEALELVGLIPKKFLHRAWHELSSGETQRIALASRLILKPKTLLLDEPTNSLDINGIPQFTEAILHANREWGTTIVIASHDLLWLSSIATRKIGLHFGRLMDFSTTNLIVGKWQEIGDEIVFFFDEKEHIALPKSWRIGEKRGIAINPREIIVAKQAFESVLDENVYLKGTIREVLHLPKTNEVSLKITLGHHSLECIEPLEAFQKRPFYPTQEAYLSFPKHSINASSKESTS